MSSLQGLCLVLRIGKTKTVAGRPVAAIRGCGRAASGWAAPWDTRSEIRRRGFRPIRK